MLSQEIPKRRPWAKIQQIGWSPVVPKGHERSSNACLAAGLRLLGWVPALIAGPLEREEPVPIVAVRGAVRL